MMKLIIEQFEDKGLAHFSYAVQSLDRIILIDPARDPRPYYEFAEKNGARIVGVIETHPHADFVSSHLEIHHHTGATIYVSKLVGADYPHKTFDEGEQIELSQDVLLRALHTPGHSPDSISVVVSVEGKDHAVFTGDTLFIGDVGRPDLREQAGKMRSKREELAKMMYHTIRDKFLPLADDVLVYPAHGAGSLCGKSLSDAQSSTMGHEKASNYALQERTEEAFVDLLLEDQPFIPKYFPYDVDLNKQGAPNYLDSIQNVKKLAKNFQPDHGAIIVDGRPSTLFRTSHPAGAINIMDGEKFETWLGSIIAPTEKYFLIAQDDKTLDNLIRKSAKIGYELNIEGSFVYDAEDGEKAGAFDKHHFKSHKEKYTIVDIRNRSEVETTPIFEQSINIPLPELRERVEEIPEDNPIVVHCSGGYRSAAASSIIKKQSNTPVYDMSEAVKDFTGK